MPGSRNQADPNAAARHSKLRNGSSNQGGQLQQINVGSGKASNKKATGGRDGGALGEIH